MTHTRMLIALALLVVSGLPAAAQTPKFPAHDILRILEETRDACPRAWRNAHRRDTGEQFDFVIEAVKRLYAASGGTVGGNWRVGRVGDLSMDGITVEATDGRYYFSDIIIAAGTDDARLTFGISEGTLLRDGAGNYIGELGFVPAHALPAPRVPCAAAPPPPPSEPPPPPPPPPSVNLTPVLDAIAQLRLQVEALRAQLDAMREKVDQAAYESLQAALRASDIKTAIEALKARPIAEGFPTYVGRVPMFGGTVTLTPQP